MERNYKRKLAEYNFNNNDVNDLAEMLMHLLVQYKNYVGGKDEVNQRIIAAEIALYTQYFMMADLKFAKVVKKSNGILYHFKDHQRVNKYSDHYYIFCHIAQEAADIFYDRLISFSFDVDIENECQITKKQIISLRKYGTNILVFQLSNLYRSGWYNQLLKEGSYGYSASDEEDDGLFIDRLEGDILRDYDAEQYQKVIETLLDILDHLCEIYPEDAQFIDLAFIQTLKHNYYNNKEIAQIIGRNEHYVGRKRKRYMNILIDMAAMQAA